MAKKTKAEAEQTRLGIIGAAQRTFHEFGVSSTSLEKVARVAGVTRGAIYWHFKNKAALFHAMRFQVLNRLSGVDDTLMSDGMANPLDTIEKALTGFIEVLESDPSIRQTFEIMLWRCEYVGEFAPVLHEVTRPRRDFQSMIHLVYQRAAQKGFLRPSLDPEAMALDTVSFATGLLHHWLYNASNTPPPPLDARELIRNHIALRRRD